VSGRTSFRPVHLVEAIYRNRYSVPYKGSMHDDELDHTFDGEQDPKSFHYARPGLSGWAAQLVGKRCALEVGKLGYEDPDHPDFRVFLQSSVSDRMAGTRRAVTQDDVFQFSMRHSATILRARAPLAWYLTECMAATMKNGIIVVRTRRPHSSGI
ncbi:hypothetical protein B0H14DRAFT_2374748, partial [Mycena olivaceomarginata]